MYALLEAGLALDATPAGQVGAGAPQPGQTMYRVVRINERFGAGDLNNAGQVAFAEFTEEGRFILKFYDAMGTTTIGTLGGPSAFVSDLNNNGQFAGFSNVDERTHIFHAFRWSRQGGLVDLGVPAGYESSMATAINDSGLVVGDAGLAEGFGSATLLWDPQGGVRDLGHLGFPFARPVGINNAGRVAGNGLTADQVPMAYSWTEAEGLIGLMPPGGLGSGAAAINASGQIVGTFSTEEGMEIFLWTPGRGFGIIEGPPAFPLALSDTGWIAGVLMDQRPFVWHRDLGMVDIGLLPGASHATAYDVNNRGQVVGDPPAFLWTEDEGLVDLSQRLLDPAPAALDGARRINNNGVILAMTSAGLLLLHPQPGSLPAPFLGPINVAAQPRSGHGAVFAASVTHVDTRTRPRASWNWGDGSESEGLVLLANGSGTVTGTHTYAAPGAYTVVLTVAGANGQSRSVSRTVEVA